MARMEETLDDVASAYQGGAAGTEAFAAFLDRYARDPKQYKQSAEICAAILARGEELAASGNSWRSLPRIRDGRIPQPATNLRIAPKP